VQIVPEKSSAHADHLIQALFPVLELVDVGIHDATVDGKLRITVVGWIAGNQFAVGFDLFQNAVQVIPPRLIQRILSLLCLDLFFLLKRLFLSPKSRV